MPVGNTDLVRWLLNEKESGKQTHAVCAVNIILIT